ncbi:RNA polymerase sigma factor [Larkinella insperata]|uniref:RNA polymerase sigma factor n=1 Tax=Larkinella insperata TaxID=332158 RepID=A0ABW3QAN6_9BACT|nr:sigma-70 family RNA polymerase sigma factor [Larkinella insperata]
MSVYSDYVDHDLLPLLAEGDEEAFAEIYRRYWQRLYSSAYKRLRNEDQCQDLVQNVFTDLWERKAQHTIDNLPAYLFTAVRFQVLKQVSRQPGTADLLDAFEAILTSPIHSDDSLLEQEILNLVKLWVAALPEKRREIFLMYYSQDLSTADIADSLGVSQKTVQNQLHTATTALRARLARILLAALLASIIPL